MLTDRDDVVLHILAMVDRLDGGKLDAVVEFVTPMLSQAPATPAAYPFLIRTDKTTTRALAEFVESAFLCPSATATRH